MSNFFKPIQTKIPPRLEGQKDVLLLTAPAMDTVRIGFIGLGKRGREIITRFGHIDGAEIVALCDISTERVKKGQSILKNNNKAIAIEYSGEKNSWRKLCESDEIDLVYIVTNWETHAEIALYAMEHGKHVAVEVPGAMTLKEIWDIIDTSERTRKHCIMLENCVYDFFELTTLNMAQNNVFGEIIHAEGAYIHNLEEYWNHTNLWRLEYNQKNRGDLYPTHGLGPICQALNIHRGDKMNYLVSMDSNPFSGIKTYQKQFGQKPNFYKNGDHTITFIKTELGKTMQIQHNIMSPRPYSRMYQLTGTIGFANKYPIEGYSLKPEKSNIPDEVNFENLDIHKFIPDSLKNKLMKKYKHPIHRELEKYPNIEIELEEKGKTIFSHTDMNFIMEFRLIYCLRHGLPLDMDVYDLAEWSCLTELTSISLENNSCPVEIPDFTRGKWNKLKGYQHSYI